MAHAVWAPLAAAVGLVLSGAPLAAQLAGADSSGVLTGALTGAEDAQPIPYGTVILTASGRASFADATGAFRLGRLVPATYAIRARQIGYAPLDTTVVVAPGPVETVVRLRLHRIAFRLAEVGVHGRRPKGCVATGIPDSTVNPTLAAVFSQVRENVDRLRILLDQYPFTFSREERRVLRRDPGGDSTEAVDTVDYESRARRPYRVGGIIYVDFDAVGRRQRFMYLPNFRDLADPAFLSAHCFTYGGTEMFGGAAGTKVVRIDFQPASRIPTPDVEGEIDLDATRFVVRRAVFRMTKPQAANPPVLGLSVTTTFRELVPLVPVFDSVESIQDLPDAAGEPRVPDLQGGAVNGPARRSAIDEDRLLGFTFEQRAPGEQSGGPSPTVAPATMAGAPPASGPTATSGPPATLVTGRVVDADGTPVAGATIGLFGFRDTVTTSDSGRFTLPGLPGPRMLLIRRLGFEAARVPVTVVRDRAREVSVTLVRTVPVLPTVITTADERAAYHAVGLDQRMQAGIGQFLTYDQIQRRHATTFSQLLQTMRGIRLWHENHSFGTTVEGTRGAGSCVSYTIDGVPQTQLMDQTASGHPESIAPESPDNLIDPSEIGAIEVYTSGERPAGMGGMVEHPLSSSGDRAAKVDVNGQQCVLVVIWTRAYLGLPSGPEASRTGVPEGTHGRPVFPNLAMCEPEPTSDTVAAVLTATLQASASRPESDTAWSGYVDGVLAAVRRAFVMPSDLPMPVFGYPFSSTLSSVAGKQTPGNESPAVVTTLSTVIAFSLDTAGAIEGLRTAASSLSGPADTSLLAAITEASAAHAFPSMPASARSLSPVHFDLVVSTAHGQGAARSTVLGRVLVPVWPLRRVVAIASGTQPSLAPADGDAIHAGSDSVMLEFVVDDRGRAVMSTVRELNEGREMANDQTARAFRSRVIRALPGFRFDPALIGACPVPEMTTTEFTENGIIGPVPGIR